MAMRKPLPQQGPGMGPQGVGRRGGQPAMQPQDPSSTPAPFVPPMQSPPQQLPGMMTYDQMAKSGDDLGDENDGFSSIIKQLGGKSY